MQTYSFEIFEDLPCGLNGENAGRSTLRIAFQVEGTNRHTILGAIAVALNRVGGVAGIEIPDEDLNAE